MKDTEHKGLVRNLFSCPQWNSDSVCLSLSSASDCCKKLQTLLIPPTITRTPVHPTPSLAITLSKNKQRWRCLLGVGEGEWQRMRHRNQEKMKQKKAKRKSTFDWCYVPSLKRATPETPSWSVSLSSAISFSESKENVLPESLVSILGSRRVESVLPASGPLLLL